MLHGVARKPARHGLDRFRLALFGHGERGVNRIGNLLVVVRIDDQGFGQLLAAPAVSLSTSMPLLPCLTATYSLAIKFMPSRTGVISATSAKR